MSDEDYRIVVAMKEYGGGFSKALAAAALMADEENLERIKRTWSFYWTHYRLLGEAMAAKKISPCVEGEEPKP